MSISPPSSPAGPASAGAAGQQWKAGVLAKKRRGGNTSEGQISSRRTGSRNTSERQRLYHAVAGLGQHARAGVGCGCGAREKHRAKCQAFGPKPSGNTPKGGVCKPRRLWEDTAKGTVSRCDGTGAPGCGLLSAGSGACRKTRKVKLKAKWKTRGRLRNRQLNAVTTTQRSDNSPWAVCQRPQGKAVSSREDRQCLREERQWENTHTHTQ